MKNESTINYEKLDALNDAIVKALHELYDRDRDLIHCDHFQELKTVQKHLAERAIAFRFGLYFKEFCPLNDNIIIDMEYNRHLYDQKLMKYSNGVEKGMIPDLIVHERRCDDNNLLVVEFKGWWNTSKTQDRKKLRYLTDPDEAYRYQCGLLITFEKTDTETMNNIEVFQQGEKVKNSIIKKRMIDALVLTEQSPSGE